MQIMANKVRFLLTFRARLMMLLASCLLLTIIIVLALDYWAQQSINAEIEKQQKDVTEVINGGFGDQRLWTNHR